MFGLSETFQLDPRLEADTHHLHTVGMVQLRLMDDKRWPWIILVPTSAKAADIDDLNYPQIEELMSLAADVSKTLKQLPNVSSSNVATLSNIVTQLHMHVVGRTEGDTNWPGPVWGFGVRESYTSTEVADFASSFDEAWASVVPKLRRWTSL